MSEKSFGDYTLAELGLATELHAHGVAARRLELARAGRLFSEKASKFDGLDHDQIMAWLAIARRVNELVKGGAS